MISADHLAELYKPTSDRRSVEWYNGTNGMGFPARAIWIWLFRFVNLMQEGGTRRGVPGGGGGLQKKYD